MHPVAKYFYIIGGLFFTGYLLVISASLFNPLLGAFIFAMALRPLATRLEAFKIPRLLSSLLTVFLFVIIFLGMVLFFSIQVKDMNFEVKTVGENFNGIAGKIQHWLTDLTGISIAEQSTLLKEAFNTALRNSALYINKTLSATTNVVTSFVIFIISLFFFLQYRRFFISFLAQMVSVKNHARLIKTLNKMQAVVKSYILGLLLIILIVATLNTIGLLVLGISNAMLFGVMAAVLTLIPYIGILLGALLPTAFALFTTNSLWYPLGVIIIFMFIQFLEGNVLTPNIVGRQVSINPFAAILGLIVGSMLLGLPGIMFALPVLAMIKVICDEVNVLKPFGYLLGNPSA